MLSGEQNPRMHVSGDEGSHELDWQNIEAIVDESCEGLAGVEPGKLLESVKRNIYDGITIAELHTGMVKAADTLIEEDPNYRFVAGRLLMVGIRREVATKLQLNVLGQAVALESQELLQQLYGVVFKAAVELGVNVGQLNPALKEFDLDFLGNCLRADWDFKFDGVGLQAIYDRYLLRHDNQIYELPQILFMRVAMGLALNETNRDEAAAAFYAQLASFNFMSSTPTLFNSGTVHSQLSSCYLSTVSDDIGSIFQLIADNAMLAKWAGGLGNDWTQIRARGSYIKGTNGTSKGVVPFLNIADATAVAVNQGGKRAGAVCFYLENWHLDFESFLELRKNTGDHRLRTEDTDTAAWIPDLFMKRVQQKKTWTLFSPDDVPDLHDLYGKKFEKRYEEYERQTETGEIKLFKRVDAVKLWQATLTALVETGHPWITFKDAANIRSPQQHTGVIHSSNLCTEITLNTSSEEIAVCNLGSINLANHVDDYGKVDDEKLRTTVKLAIQMLDNVIDINYYAVKAAENSNMRHRPIGLGMMGFQDALFKKRIPYSTDEAIEFADEITEKISYYAIDASADLAVERGRYKSFEGSLWDKGILPIDSLKMLEDERRDGAENYLEADFTTRLDWDGLRAKIQEQGMRNSNVLAIAPTATISLIAGVSMSIEPIYANLYAKDNLSGMFTLLNPYLFADLRERDLWNKDIVDDLKRSKGRIKEIKGIPDDLKFLYLSAYEVHPRWLIEAAARRQKWIDQSQSLNLFFMKPSEGNISGKLLDLVYTMAWQRGLKTTYYLKSEEASSVERTTLDDNELTAVSPTPTASESTQMNGTTNTKIHAHANGQPPTATTGIGTDSEPQICLLEDPECESCQ